MRLAMIITFASVFATNVLAAHAQDVAAASVPVPLTVETINAARIDTIAPELALPTTDEPATAAEKVPDPAVVRLQILLDQGGASPGVIDGFDGENVRKAVLAFEVMHSLPVDGSIDPDVIAALETGQPVVGEYAVTAEDTSAIVAPIPTDYAEKATRDFLGYESVAEQLAERFHMDIDLLKALNPGAGFAEGERIVVAAYGPNLVGEVARIEADKGLRQVRAYDASDRLIAAYPATIGSKDNPSPSGTHVVEGVAPMPNYTYNPKINFQQGENTEVLTIPPGPNGPVGSMWIDLSEPTFGIHGTPEPSLIDKVSSYGCVRLTNWDAEELSTMVKPGVTVVFTG